MAPDLMFRTRTPPATANTTQFCVVAVQPAGVMTKGQNTPRSLPVFVDSNGHPINLLAPAPAPAEKPKIVVQGAAYMSMVVNELHEEGKIEFKGKLPTLPPQFERSKQAHKPEGSGQPAAGITVQGDVAQCIVGQVVKSKGGISFGGGS